MQSKTLNSYIQKLKPVHQDYIVYCVQVYGSRPDFHRGMLPFLSAQEAANCLKLRFEMLSAIGPHGLGPNNTILSAPETIKGARFIKSILSVIADALPHKLYEDEDSTQLYLNDKRLAKYFGRRFSKKFYINSLQIGGKLPSNQLVELEWLRENQWRITTHANRLEKAVHLLTDIGR